MTEKKTRKKRSYRQTRRAELREQTRSRIVQATMELHEEIGPARTTISAIAERAGVERLTVYRHFPDERGLFRACSGRFLELHPTPRPESWSEEASPEARARAALEAFYRYYAETEAMWKKVYRDLELVPANAEVTAELESYLDSIRDGLARALAGRGGTKRHRDLAAVLGHGLRFSTWASLEREGLSDEAKVELLASALTCLSESRRA